MKVFLLALHLSLALSAPSCKFTGRHGTTYFCHAGATDYVLKRGLVSDNNTTTVVILRNCRITEIDFESFDGLPATQTIDMSSNKIQTLQLGILDESRNVKKLNLSFNSIREIPLGLFDRMPNLELLDVRGNKFQNFELGVFDPTKKLRHLDLSSNKLISERLSPYLFDDSPKIQFLDFSRNDMRKASDIILNSQQVLDLLNLDGCSLDQVPVFSVASNLVTLRHLLLSGNKISSITNPTTFQNLVGLQILDLTGNEIVSLHQNVFKPLTKLSILTLRYNRIQELPETLFQNLAHLANLDLSHNVIQFVPDTSFLGLPSLKRLNLSINRFTFLPDRFCENLAKSGTELAKFYFNQNPWQCSCLREILTEVKSQKIMYNDNKYKGKNPVCVDPEIRISCKRTLSESLEMALLFDATIKLG